MSLSRAAGRIVSLIKQAFGEFQRHKDQWLAAAIAYFALFAVAPLVIVVVEIAGLVLGRDREASAELYRYLATAAGPSAATGIESIVTATMSHRGSGALAQVIAWGVVVLGALGLFGSLQEALNTVWEVVPARKSLLDRIKERLVAFGMVMCVAFVLLASLALNSVLTIASAALARVLPFFPTLLSGGDFALSFALIATLFALLFKYLPECPVAWRDVWLGAVLSALLFVAGQFLFGWYIGRAGIASGYGAFAGLVVFLLWSYYSAQMFLLGAEFARVSARSRQS
jgi:membrane protein